MNFKLFNVEIETAETIRMPEEVHETVKSIDIAMEKLAEAAEKTRLVFAKYSSSNAGDQFYLAYDAMTKLSKDISEYATNINGIEHQVCDLFNRILNYEGRNGEFQYRTAKIAVTTNQAETQKFKYSADEIREILAALITFQETVDQTVKQTQQESEDVRAIWNDAQYIKFKEYIDSCMESIIAGTLKVNEYVEALINSLTHLKE
ncbi:MAG: hypothetical protein IKU45_01035 [Clostridia bacterium]|nr:hypothetical protein [Clostridia bacterium]